MCQRKSRSPQLGPQGVQWLLLGCNAGNSQAVGFHVSITSTMKRTNHVSQTVVHIHKGLGGRASDSGSEEQSSPSADALVASRAAAAANTKSSTR
jgi:hypothetical protein